MRVTVTLTGVGTSPGEQERDLGQWLDQWAQLRGRVRVVDARSQSGALSGAVAAVLADLGPAACTAFASALIAWIRHRTSSVRVVVRRPDGARMELSAQRVRGLGDAEVRALTEQIAQALDGTIGQAVDGTIGQAVDGTRNQDKNAPNG